MKVKKLSAKHKQNISKGLAGRILSAETKKKISNANKGNKITKKHIHDLFHDIYGRGNNTNEQFEEFRRCIKYI